MTERGGKDGNHWVSSGLSKSYLVVELEGMERAM